MGTSTFSGPVRSENGFQTVSKDASGNITVLSGAGLPAVGIEATTVLTYAEHAGRALYVQGYANETSITLPTVEAGSFFELRYSASSATTNDLAIASSTPFSGNVIFHDTDNGAVSVVGAIIELGDFVIPDTAAFNLRFEAGYDSNVWIITGTVVGSVAPSFT